MLPLVEVAAQEFSAKPLDAPHIKKRTSERARNGIRSAMLESGHCIGATENPASGQVHAVGSVIAQLSSGQGITQGVLDENIRYRKISARGRRTILFLVDTSGSMVPSDRLAMVKGCVMSLLKHAYVSRTRVAIIGFGGQHARVVLPFTSSPEVAATHIDKMAGGGSTPLLEALDLATHLLEQEKDVVELVVLSDGRYDRPRGIAAERTIQQFGMFCAKRHDVIHYVDVGSGLRTSKKRSQFLASMLRADYRHLEDLRNGELVDALETPSEPEPSRGISWL